VTADFVQQWFVPAFIAFAMIMYASGIAGYRVQRDASSRGLGKAAVTFWSVAVIFFGPVFLPLYLIFRARAVFAGANTPEPVVDHQLLCPHCGEKNPADQQTCSACHKYLNENVSLVGEKQCPYCGRMNRVDASRCSNCDQLIGKMDEEE
jgi:hypothetical protein